MRKFYFYPCKRRYGAQLTFDNQMIAGLSSYNKYLRKSFDLQFDETRVSSNIICSSDDKQSIVVKIEKSFDNPVDTLKPANCLSGYANIKPEEQFLIEVRLSTEIKEIATLVIAIIPVLMEKK